MAGIVVLGFGSLELTALADVARPFRAAVVLSRVGEHTIPFRGRLRQRALRPFGAEPLDLAVIILSPEMAGRLGRPPEVLGVTPRAPSERGRVAYIFHERIKSLARDLKIDEAAVLGDVIAHEAGHLLLPFDAHSTGGIMRPQWDPRELQHGGGRLLLFTPQQAELIRMKVSSASVD